MYKHILIATDGSELAGRALAHGLALAKELNAPVTVVTVTQPWSAPEMALFSAGKANLARCVSSRTWQPLRPR